MALQATFTLPTYTTGLRLEPNTLSLHAASASNLNRLATEDSRLPQAAAFIATGLVVLHHRLQQSRLRCRASKKPKNGDGDEQEVQKVKKKGTSEEKPKVNSEVSAKMQKLQALFTKKFGEDSIVSMDQDNMKVDTFSTGALTLDMALGGGIPLGRLTEIYGPESSGKTTMALSCIAGAQKKYPDKLCLFIDSECAFDREYAEKCGVDLKRLQLASPECAEEAQNMAIEAAHLEECSLIIIDSIAALCPREEQEKDMTEKSMALLARLMSKFCRKIAPILRQTNTALFLTNQLRANPSPYGAPEVTSGGNAVKYAASVRMDIRAPKSELLGPKEDPIGITAKVKVTKNKLAAPHRKAEFDIIFAPSESPKLGISWESSVFDAAAKKGVIEKGGAWYKYKDLKVQGREKFIEHLNQHPEVCDELEQIVRKKMASEPPEDVADDQEDELDAKEDKEADEGELREA